MRRTVYAKSLPSLSLHHSNPHPSLPPSLAHAHSLSRQHPPPSDSPLSPSQHREEGRQRGGGSGTGTPARHTRRSSTTLASPALAPPAPILVSDILIQLPMVDIPPRTLHGERPRSLCADLPPGHLDSFAEEDGEVVDVGAEPVRRRFEAQHVIRLARTPCRELPAPRGGGRRGEADERRRGHRM